MKIKTKKPLEKDICKMFMRRFEVMNAYKQFKKKMSIFHIANEQYNNKSYTISLMQMGLKAGVADYCLLMEGGRTAFLEFKRCKSSKLSSNQETFRDVCQSLGIPYEVFYEVDSAIDWIKRFSASF